MKTTVINPFIISGYLSSTYFCNRKKETAELLESLQNGRNVTLISPRRMGKTGLIHHLFHTLKRSSKDVVTIYVDLFSTTNLTEFTKLFADSVFGQLDSNPTKLLAKLTSFFKGLRPTIKLDEFTGMPKLSVEIDSGEESKTLKQFFEYLKSSSKECYIAFDEFQQIAAYPQNNVEALLRSHIQNMHNVHFIFSGSKEHLLSHMFLSPKRPFYKSTSSITLSVIPQKEYFAFAASFFKKQGRILPKEVFHTIYTNYQGHTWYIQKVLNHIYAKSNRDITEGLVKDVIIEIIKENEFYYQMLLRAYPNRQGRLLKAVAKQKVVAEIMAGSFIAANNLVATSSVSGALKRLLEDEILYLTPDGYIVYDRFFGQWLASLP